jgi:hypothetical protein
MVLGVEMRGDWWTDPEKHHDLSPEEHEIDCYALELQNPPVVAHKIYDQEGNVTETVHYSPGNITITHHLHYRNTPYEKSYQYYLLRCKNILWLILYQ